MYVTILELPTSLLIIKWFSSIQNCVTLYEKLINETKTYEDFPNECDRIKYKFHKVTFNYVIYRQCNPYFSHTYTDTHTPNINDKKMQISVNYC